MARPRKDNSGIKKKQKNYLDFLKILTKFITNPKRDVKYIENIIEKYEVESQTIFQRVLGYCYNKPHLIWYFNKYFNDLYKFSKYDPVNLLMSMIYIMEKNDHVKSDKILFLKSNDFKDQNKQKVKKVLNEYFLFIYSKQLNDLELNFYYKLFLNGKISVDDIYEMDYAINGEQSKLEIEAPENIKESEELQIDINKYLEEERIKPLSPNISQFVLEFKSTLQSRDECKKCKLYGHKPIILDTNLTDFGEVDFAFIGLNPSSDETLYNKPFTSESGLLLRKKLKFLPPDVKWVLYNIILCETRNQKDIGKNSKEISEVTNCCIGNLPTLWTKFPAKYCVPIGSETIKTLNIKGSILSISGDIIQHGEHKFIPMVSPNAVLQYPGNNQKGFEKAWDTIFRISGDLYSNNKSTNFSQVDQIISNIATNNKKQINSNKIQVNIKPEKIITEITEDLTLLDVINLNDNQIMKIFIDEDGQKKYYFEEDSKMPIYVKYGSWKTCDMLEENMDAVIYIDGRSRYKLSQSIRDSLNIIKKTCTTPD